MLQALPEQLVHSPFYTNWRCKRCRSKSCSPELETSANLDPTWTREADIRSTSVVYVDIRSGNARWPFMLKVAALGSRSVSRRMQQ